MVNDSADVTSSGRSFHVSGPATGKAWLPTVDSLPVGTTRRLMPTERSIRWMRDELRSTVSTKLYQTADQVKIPKRCVMSSMSLGTKRRLSDHYELIKVSLCAPNCFQPYHVSVLSLPQSVWSLIASQVWCNVM